jgi:uncharacterized membrane protein
MELREKIYRIGVSIAVTIIIIAFAMGTLQNYPGWQFLVVVLTALTDIAFIIRTISK